MARQLLKPEKLGQKSISTSSSGIMSGRYSSRPVVDDVLVAEVGRVAVVAGLGVQLPEDAELAHGEDRPAASRFDHECCAVPMQVCSATTLVV